MTNLIIGGLIALILAIVCGKIFIPVLHRLKFGQEIREEGPKWHQAKSGTPTMGGFIFIVAMVVSLAICLVLGFAEISTSICLIIVSLLFGGIGFIDDYIKVILKRNLGLTAKQKFGLQFLVAVAFSLWISYMTDIGTVISVPFTSAVLDLGWIYIPFVTIVILATVNSVNLTDGLDGLATSVTIIVAIFFMLISQQTENSAVALFGAIMLGSLIGFLLYNWKPAKVFMGDTGSLFLGGAVCAMAIILRQPLTLLIVGFVYVMESLSVIMQVTSFKLTGKRIFKMSPIHHHFEMCGLSEQKIVGLFSAVTFILCAVMYYFG